MMKVKTYIRIINKVKKKLLNIRKINYNFVSHSLL
jgi:hypothetical protein